MKKKTLETLEDEQPEDGGFALSMCGGSRWWNTHIVAAEAYCAKASVLSDLEFVAEAKRYHFGLGTSMIAL